MSYSDPLGRQHIRESKEKWRAEQERPFRLLTGDAIEQLRTLPAESVHCVVTSPPYWGLRDYGVDGQIGLEETPEAWVAKLVDVFREVRRVLRADGTCWVNLGDSYAQGGGGGDSGASSTLEGSTRGQDESKRAQSRMRSSTLAHEGATWGPGEFPARVQGRSRAAAGIGPKNLVGQPWMFAFAARETGWTLRMDVIWSKRNPLPESVLDRPTKSHEYIFLLAKSTTPTFWVHREGKGAREFPAPDFRWEHADTHVEVAVEPPPHWVWVHRKTRERRTDDPGSEEWRRVNLWQRFNLWEGRDYFYDLDAIREPYKPESIARRAYVDRCGHTGDRRGEHQPGRDGKAGERPAKFYEANPAGRNRRSVWEIATARFEDAHFATFPEDLVEPCVMAGSSEGGSCSACGAPRRRVVELGEHDREHQAACGADSKGEYHGKATKDFESAKAQDASAVKARILDGMRERRTIAWAPSCSCGGSSVVPCTVLDPFSGSGTTGAVALRLGRRYIGIELNSKYQEEIARPRLDRIAAQGLLRFHEVDAAGDGDKTRILFGNR